MASIHISELQKLLAAEGQRDAEPHGPEGYFLEIRFDDPHSAYEGVDPEFRDRVLTADCPYGMVTIQFDHQEIGRAHV